jgi:hypothetical protein
VLHRIVLCLVVVAMAGSAFAQNPRWTDNAEYQMFARIYEMHRHARMDETYLRPTLDALLEWEDTYPNSELGFARTRYILSVLDQMNARGIAFHRDVKSLYRILVLALSMPSRSAGEIEAIHHAANTLLAELNNPSAAQSAPGDAKEVAVRALELKTKEEADKHKGAPTRSSRHARLQLES